MASSVQRGAARHDQDVSTAAVRGAPRATVQIPAWLASSWLLAQYGVSISAAPMSGSSPTRAIVDDRCRGPRRVSARRSYPRRGAGPPVAARCVVPLRRGPHPADAHRRGDDVRGAGWFRLRRVRRPHRAPPGAGAALAPEGARGTGPPRPAGVGGRRRLRPRLPRPPLRPARPRHGGAAAGARRAAGRPAAGPVAAALGDLPRRGSGGRPVRRGHQDPPRDGRRPRIDGRRDAAARRHSGRARHPARRLVPRPGAVVTGSGDRRRARGDAAAPHGARRRRAGPRRRP